MTSHIVLSTDPVENPVCNSSNPVESGLVFEMVKSGPVQSGSGLAPARIPDLVAHW